ncbi:MAG: hypothetical protein PHI97_06085 [Desulfobulbus sp.]|nr:hypothetical protein [Desulfobulbus sp.]
MRQASVGKNAATQSIKVFTPPSHRTCYPYRNLELLATLNAHSPPAGSCSKKKINLEATPFCKKRGAVERGGNAFPRAELAFWRKNIYPALVVFVKRLVNKVSIFVKYCLYALPLRGFWLFTNPSPCNELQMKHFPASFAGCEV